jgi:hypothetical protein
MRPHFLAAAALLAAPPAAFGLGNFENPPSGPVSGATLVSGWHCSATRIEIEFDGTTRKPAASGTDRPDTEGVCGKRDNGFGLLVNWADLGPGTHTVSAYADGALMDTRTVNVVTYGVVFLAGRSASTTVPNFPDPGKETVLDWRPGLQSFSASAVRNAPGISGTWNGANLEKRTNCTSLQNNGTRGTYAQWDASVNTNDNTLRIQETGITGLSCTYRGGFRVNGNNPEWFDGTYTCTDGKTGTFHSTEFMVTARAFSIRLATKLTGSETCDIDAILGGSRF